MTDLIVKTALAQLPSGQVSNAADADYVIKNLQTLGGGSVQSQIQIQDYMAKKNEMLTKQQDVLSSKDVFDQQLNEALTQATAKNFDNPLGVIGTQAALYSDAADTYESTLTSGLIQRYGTIDKVPAEAITYGNTLKEKAKMMVNLYNSYNPANPTNISPDGTIGAGVNADAYAVLLTTNPNTGAVIRFDIVPSDQVKTDQFMKTDVPFNVAPGQKATKLPTYVLTYDIGKTSDGKSTIVGANVGGLKMQAVKGDGVEAGVTNNILTPTRESQDQLTQSERAAANGGKGEGFLTSAARFFLPRSLENAVLGDQNQGYYNYQKDGLTLGGSGLKFDSNDIPPGQVLRMGSRWFYSNDQGGVMEAQGASQDEKVANLKKYLGNTGNDIKKIDQPYLIDRSYLSAPDGSSRLKGDITPDTLGMGPVPATAPQMSFAPAAMTSPNRSRVPDGFFSGGPKAPAVATNSSSTSAFASRTNTPPATKVATETGSNPLATILQKGKSFFSGKGIA
jgi:hypothetical protein